MVEMHLGEAYRHLVKPEKPHPHSAILYWIVFAVLIGLTILTVVLSGYDFGSLSVFVTLLIASIKASLVLAFFMHLWFDSKFYALVISTTLIFLSLFIVFPIVDAGSRGFIDSFKANFLPRDEAVYDYQLKNPKALPLRPKLQQADPDRLIFIGPESEGHE